MSGKDAFTVEGIVIEVLSARTCRARLGNGHMIFGFVADRSEILPMLAEGQKLWFKLSPFDLSEGRVITERRQN